MQLRKDLSESQKEYEPLNGDSHLTFIGAGLKNCVTYHNDPELPIYFIDLDGVYKEHHRNRRTRVLAYNREETVYQGRFPIQGTGEHPVSSFNLRDPRYGLFPYLNDLLRTHRIEKGLVSIGLGQGERHAALTVNEYETLLMRKDLPEALQNPVRYMLRRGRRLLRNPGSIPGKTRSYVTYDLIHLYNELMKNLRIGHTLVNKVVSQLSSPVFYVFRLKRQVTLLVSNGSDTGVGQIVQGIYQSPILLQHQRPERGARSLEISLKRFD
jgi:hypothetical protein